MLALPRFVALSIRATYKMDAAAVKTNAESSMEDQVVWPATVMVFLSKSGVLETEIGCHRETPNKPTVAVRTSQRHWTTTKLAIHT